MNLRHLERYVLTSSSHTEVVGLRSPTLSTINLLRHTDVPTITGAMVLFYKVNNKATSTADELSINRSLDNADLTKQSTYNNNKLRLVQFS